MILATAGEVLSIVGVIVSVVGVVLSLLLFNASINNQRKVLLNDTLRKIEKEVFIIFNTLNTDENRINMIDNYVRALIRIDKDLNNIKYNNKYGVPGIGQSTTYDNENNKATQTFKFDESLRYLIGYFKLRNIEGVELLLDFYNDRFSILQMFKQVRKYKRKMFIGPIYGVKIIAKRSNKEIAYTSKKKYKVIKSINSEKDLKRHYDETYVLSNLDLMQKPEPFERKSLDIIRTTDKGKERPITIYN